MSRIHSKTQGRESAPETAGTTIRQAGHYDTFVRLIALGQDKAFRRMTAEMAQVKPGDTVLEVGCGTGELALAAKALAGAGGSMYGIDASPEMIEVARAKVAKGNIDIDFRVGLIEALTFEDSRFDVVLSSLMMHHLPDELKRKGLAEIYRVLKRGGKLFIVDIKRATTLVDRALMTLMQHGNIHTGVQDLPAMLTEAGFTKVESGKTPYVMIGFTRGEANK